MLTVTKVRVFEQTDNAVRAVVDVSMDVALGDGTKGQISVNGFRVIEGRNGKGPWVSFPAKQGAKTWFDIVAISGPLQKRVCDAVLAKYAEALRERSQRRDR